MHEYLRRIFAAQQQGLIDTATAAVANIAHDNWCGVYSEKECNCDPEITVATSDGYRFQILANGSLRALDS